MSQITVSVTETPIDVVLDDSGTISVNLSPTTVVVEASTTGPQGPSGLQGLAGIQGATGEAPIVSYVYNQSNTSDTWEITHNLGWYPNVTVVDSAGSIVEGEIEYPSSSAIRLLFAYAFSGNAYLS